MSLSRDTVWIHNGIVNLYLIVDSLWRLHHRESTIWPTIFGIVVGR